VWCAVECAIEDVDCCNPPIPLSLSHSASSCIPLCAFDRVRCRFGTATAIGRFVLADPFGGAAAIGITEFFTAPFIGVPPLDNPEGGDSDPATLFDCVDVGVVAELDMMEFFLVADFFAARVEAPETGTEFPLPLFRFFITSVFSESGRTTPCSFKNSPQALHRGWPSGFLLHRGVVWVKQLVHVVGKPLLAPLAAALLPFEPSGVGGLEGSVELKPWSGGELGLD